MKTNLLRIGSALLALLTAGVMTAAPALADHGYWVQGVACNFDDNTITIYGYFFGVDSSNSDLDVWVNGSNIATVFSDDNNVDEPMNLTYSNPAFVKGAFVEVENDDFDRTDFGLPIGTVSYASVTCADSVCGNDGRINLNCSAPVAVYCDSSDVEVWKLDSENEGSFLFRYDLASLPDPGSSNTLLKQVGQVKLFLRHEDGLLMLYAPQADGKVYYMLFDSALCKSEREGAEWGLK